ncbi:MAG: GlsB/YeaQ/YmgE family stress response membrane protein [Acidobacteria bacterium]|nr:GlsB/YeaQ/YmgE family stress response membrane protein [Acidobacteriota bacterium]MBK9527259.1 GlsB/YeaQ/YmgE family stress response membrane protein [Acidobacteriota bacterium]MBP7475189.1 GlsB/YeaQ/YmgE family stress response membrane protein [Pyrinomonadaceae bacterium]MBP9110956.1 GlsB/YeaQ/YmgE family stress response membrane protein [Pyrinomonadaceae bacterium]
MVSLLIWLLLGFLAGYLAKFILPGRDGGGVVMTTVLGILGAVVGGFMGRYFFGYPMISSFDNIGNNIPSFVSSIIGAIVVLAIFRLARGRGLSR